jgi:hypothetical protein
VGPILHPIPVAHGRFPVIAAIVGEIVEQDALHLPGNFRPFLDIELATLLVEEADISATPRLANHMACVGRSAQVKATPS